MTRAGCPVQSGLELAQGRRQPALQLQKEDPGHAHDGQYSKTHGTAHALKPKTSLQEHTTLRAIPTQSALRRSRRCRKLREHNLTLSCVVLRWMDSVARRGLLWLLGMRGSSINKRQVELDVAWRYQLKPLA
ncbi:uncharacterized protein LOC124694266 [Lolium rigidum]|uniref:uncharacterized protein LOC124694266 n=1 Tax=Lolium rigidum TaxID=89674 RepID=UPI001F5D2C3B|nr:uncharacterized protein LOC124694266 [Lolium rigidum]